MFQSWGHSHSAPAPGELDLAHPEGTYQGEVFAAWFDRWLKGADVDTGPEFEYFRPWVTYTGSAAPAYGSAPRYPLKDTLPLRLSGSELLVGPGSAVTPGSATFAAPPGGQPASYSETSALQENEPLNSLPAYDPLGTFAAFTTPVLTGDVDVVGVPELDLRLSAPASVTADPATQPTLYAKLYDVAPDGSTTLIRRLVAPVRVPSTARPLHVYLPGIVHRFATGHRLRLVVATTDQAYLSSRAPHVLSIVNDPAAPNVLTLPVTSAAAATAVPRVLGVRREASRSGAGGSAGTGGLAATGWGDGLPALAFAAALGAVWLRRRAVAA
jgi:ABC-2 type transport system ATP-binding protein